MFWEIISIYDNRKDGRILAYVKNKEKRCLRSYPKVIVENFLNEEIPDNYDIHHIDCDKSNNDISNLMIIEHGAHQALHGKINSAYEDKIAVCDACGKEFVWTAKRQSKYYSDVRNGIRRFITCSKNCSSYLGRMKQLKRVD